MMDNNVEILLVEDNPNDVRLTLHAFKQHGFTNRITLARDGEEALEYIFCTGAFAHRQIEDVPKIILLDLKLPKVDGLEVLRAIKSDPRARVIPVIILTTSKEESDIIESYQLGVNGYIVKPVAFEQFVEAIRTLGLFWLLLNQPPIIK